MDPKTWDDFSREVYGVFGIPVDATDRESAVAQIRAASIQQRPFLVSTPNLNFLIRSQSDEDFRESLLRSDFCCPDGWPIVWLARLIGAPIRERVAGSDLFETLREVTGFPPLKIFLFGGQQGIAQRACERLNQSAGGLRCVGWHYPGFLGVDAMSHPSILEEVNSSAADILSVSLGAEKGQAWLLRNHNQIKSPVRVHLGAIINFQSGNVKRAPRTLRRLGLEWLWRIKEEPYLWRRYWQDGIGLLHLLLTRAAPLTAYSWICKVVRRSDPFETSFTPLQDWVLVTLQGSAVSGNVARAIPTFREALDTRAPIVVDLNMTDRIDSRFVGLLLMVRKAACNPGMRLINVPASVRRFLTLNGFGYLLNRES